jgi:hypothetical protein
MVLICEKLAVGGVSIMVDGSKIGELTADGIAICVSSGSWGADTVEFDLTADQLRQLADYIENVRKDFNLISM